MGNFDGMLAQGGNRDWLSQLLQQAQSTPGGDIMNPTGMYGDTTGHAPFSALLGRASDMFLPPLNGGAQPPPWALPPMPQQTAPQITAPPQAQAPQQQPMAPPMGAPSLPMSILPQNVNAMPQNSTPANSAQIPPQAQNAMAQAPEQGGGFMDSFRNKMQNIAGILDPSQRAQLQETGTDPYTGQKTFAWVNPVNQTIKPANMGQASTGATADIQAAIAMPPRYNEHGRDQSFLNALDPTTKSVVTSILDGNSSVTPRNLQKFLPLATRAEQGFVGQTYSTRANGLKDFYGGGKSSETMRKTNQSALHFGELVTDKMAALPGHDLPAMNAAENFIKTNLMGSGAQGNFEVNAHALADELSGMFKGAGISDAEIRAWESKLSPNMSPEQQRGMAKTLLGLYEDSVTALDKKRQEQVGPAIAAQKGPILGPEASAALDKVRKFIGGQKVDEQKSGGGLKAGTYNWTPQGLQ